MKKRIAMLLCTAILTLGLTAVPVMASTGPYSPIEEVLCKCGQATAKRTGANRGSARIGHSPA